MRRQFTPEQKAQVALAALKGDKTINQVASEYEVNPTQVKKWRNAAKANMVDAFADKRKHAAKAADSLKQIDELHRVIGLRDAELEWLKKRSIVTRGSSPPALHATSPTIPGRPFRLCDLAGLIEPDHPALTVSRQVALLGLCRQAYYWPLPVRRRPC